MIQRIYKWVEETPPLQKIAVGVLAIVLVVLLFFFGIVRPMTAEQLTLQASIHRLEEDVSHQKGKLAQLGVLKKQVQQLRKKVEDQKKQLGLQVDLKWLLQQFSKSARALGVTITLLKPGPSTHNSVLQTDEFPITLRVKGEYHRIAMLLSRIGRLPKVLQVTDFQFRGSKEQSSPKHHYTVSAEISFIGYDPPRSKSTPSKGQAI